MLVFFGGLRQPEQKNGLLAFCWYLQRALPLCETTEYRCPEEASPTALHPSIESFVSRTRGRQLVSWIFRKIFHPFDTALGWDYWKAFADDRAYDGVSGQAYKGHGIGKRGLGCLVLCRPDQHVARTGCMQDVGGLYRYFSGFLWTTSIGDKRWLWNGT